VVENLRGRIDRTWKKAIGGARSQATTAISTDEVIKVSW
jgi:hypothetical protein